MSWIISRVLRKCWLSGFYDRFFLTRDISARMASGKFASAMALMLASGLDVDRSLEMTEKLVDNRRIVDWYEEEVGVSRFRASAYRQRGSLAAVVRVVNFGLPAQSAEPGAHPALHDPPGGGLPAAHPHVGRHPGARL